MKIKRIMNFLTWLSNLGEKSSRTDVWVFLIFLTYFGCIFNFIECSENILIKTILYAMFADLGINSVLEKGVRPFLEKNKKNDDNK